MSFIFDEWFDRVVVISLPRSAERGERALRELREKCLSENAVISRGVDGSICKKSDWWQAGNGSWGCMQSHYRVVQDALMDGVEKLLIIEDDCIWQPHAADMARVFLPQIPADWGQIYLGGQHRSEYPPSLLPGSSVVMRASSVHRTHAHAVNRPAMVKFLKHIIYAPDYLEAKRKSGKGHHIDHQLERAHRRKDWPVYAPSFWLAGQGENFSVIQKRDEPERWWHHQFGEAHRSMPLVVWDVGVADARCRRLHFGHHLEEGNPVVDTGVRDAVNQDDAVRFMEMIAIQAYRDQRLPAVSTSCGVEKVEWLAAKWLGPVLRMSESPDLDALCDFPTSRVVRHPWFHPEKSAAAAAARALGEGEEARED